MVNECCVGNPLNAITYKLIGEYEKTLIALNEILCSIPNTDNIESQMYTVKQMLAHNNPMTVAAEYPDPQPTNFVVSAPYTRFLDMLNTDMYVIFKIDNNNYSTPVYFKDSIGYEHRVVLPDATPVLANQLQLNGIYSAKYQYTGGYIILDNLVPLNPDIIV